MYLFIVKDIYFKIQRLLTRVSARRRDWFENSPQKHTASIKPHRTKRPFANLSLSTFSRYVSRADDEFSFPNPPVKKETGNGVRKNWTIKRIST